MVWLRRDGLNGEQRTRLEAAETDFQAASQEWAAHTGRRIERELGARLNSWGWFVDDCQAQKKSCITHYATEAELRTIIALLMEAAARFGDVTAQGEQLTGLDAQFQLWFQPGDFVWRTGLEPAYPQNRFWWLRISCGMTKDKSKTPGKCRAYPTGLSRHTFSGAC